jgi:flagellar basal-body rod modification protein FlgD
MAIDATSSISAATAAPYMPGSERVPQKQLGQHEFFKLLAVQLASQDPLKPMEDTDFIAQMSSFSSLEMTNSLVAAFDRFNTGQEFASAQALLGRNVTLSETDNKEVTGVVSAVFKDGSDTMITVGGTDYEVSSVRRVEMADVPLAAN